jgi:ABC-2 type transport system permease protein
MLTIALNTITEMFKKKFLHVISIIILIYLIIYAIFVNKFMESIDNQTLNTFNTFIQSTSIILLLGFYFSAMIISFMTIVSTMGTISLEVENNTVSTILTRPIKRSTYILGKLLGSNILIWLYSTIVFAAILLIGYLMGVPSLENLYLEKLFKSWAFFIIQPTAIISLSIFGGTVFKTLANGIFVIFIYILGTIGSYVEQVGSITQNDTMVSIGIISSLISPFETIYRKMFSHISESFVVSPLFGNLATSTEPSIWMIIYFFAYIIMFPAIAIKIFNKKNL